MKASEVLKSIKASIEKLQSHVEELSKMDPNEEIHMESVVDEGGYTDPQPIKEFKIGMDLDGEDGVWMGSISLTIETE